MKTLIKAFIALLFPLNLWAAAPTVDDSEITLVTTNEASYAVNIPGNACTASQALVIIAGHGQLNTTMTWPAGYTEVITSSGSGDGGSETGWVVHRNCDGTEGATFTATPSASGRAAFRVLKISGDNGTTPQAARNEGSSTSPDAPTLTPSGGSADYLWVVGYVWDNGSTATLTACPTNYTTNCASGVTGTANTVHLGVGASWRSNTASSENPGVATLDVSESWDAFTVSVAPASGSPPSFSVNPSCTGTTDGVSCTYTASATSTVYGVGVNPGDGTPTCTQIKAGQNDGGTAALWAGSDANTGSADTVVVSGSSKPVRMDMHFCLNNAGGDSAVYSGQTDKNRLSRSGFAATVMASHSSTGLCNLDSYFDPDCADGDVIEYEDDTNEDADCNISVESDGDFVLTPVGAGDCDGKRTFNTSYQDVSSATTGLFTSPTVGNFVTDDLICVNNTVPTALEELEEPIVWTLDEAITAIDLSAYFEDLDGDTLTFTLTTGSWPTGVSQSGTGNKDVTGTPTVEDLTGETIVITATDECGDSATHEFYNATNADIYVVDTWTVPNCVGLNIAECASLVVAAAPWQAADPRVSVSDFTCEAGVAPGNIFSQDPAAAEEVTAFQEITTIVAMSCDNSSIYGKAVSTEGVVQTSPLLDAEAVPGTAKLKSGIALSEEGYVYTCPWPSVLAVGYVGGLAIRQDGCSIVAEQSTIATKYYVNGLPVSYRGELSITTDAPTVIKNGLGRSGDAISVSSY